MKKQQLKQLNEINANFIEMKFNWQKFGQICVK